MTLSTTIFPPPPTYITLSVIEEIEPRVHALAMSSLPGHRDVTREPNESSLICTPDLPAADSSWLGACIHRSQSKSSEQLSHFSKQSFFRR
jgi:hypothetical protein